MAWAPGSRLGPYEITDVAGIGGMGEVYRADDTRLGRPVAIKVLPTGLASHPERRQRFEREARAVASLSHPHICTLYDIGHEGDTSYLVMEYIEGRTLADRLARGPASSASSAGGDALAGKPLPIAEALTYAIQIADALDSAHRQGIVHRDLKPANVMITRTGVKLLDFGLARVSGEAEITADSVVPTKLSLTGAGTVLGTLQYMAPEQVEGKIADHRSDIFTLAVVVYEMLTGRRAFEAQSHAGLVAAILEHEPTAVAELQPQTPPALVRLLRDCLAKNPDDRWQSAADIKRELTWIAESGSQLGVPAQLARARRQRANLLRAGNVLLLATTLLFAGLFVASRRQGAPALAPGVPLAFQVVLPGPWNVSDLALAPDGRHLAFTAVNVHGETTLWVRSMQTGELREVPDTNEAQRPFWSPDGRFVAFGVPGLLRKVENDGSLAQTICQLERRLTSGIWTRNDRIYFTEFSRPTQQVAAAGGDAMPATFHAGQRTPDGNLQLTLLPDGNGFIYRDRVPGRAGKMLLVGYFDGRQPRVLTQADGGAAVAREGYLVFGRGGALLGQRFDASAGQLEGEPFPLLGGISERQRFDVGPGGLLVYKKPVVSEAQLTWFDVEGRQLGTVGAPSQIGNLALSPDSSSVAISRRGKKTHFDGIWTTDTARGSSVRLFSDEERLLLQPCISPDGTQLAYTALPPSHAEAEVLIRPIDGGEARVAFKPEPGQLAFVEDWSRDGRTLAVLIVPNDGSAKRAALLDLTTNTGPVPIGPSDASVDELRFSPDGKWLAFGAIVAQQFEVFLTRIPPDGSKFAVSSGGGMQPHFSPDAQTMYYLGRDAQMMAVPISLGDKVDIGIPRPLFRTGLRPEWSLDQFALTRDGKRFLVAVPTDQGRPETLDFVVNWTALDPAARGR